MATHTHTYTDKTKDTFPQSGLWRKETWERKCFSVLAHASNEGKADLAQHTHTRTQYTIFKLWSTLTFLRLSTLLCLAVLFQGRHTNIHTLPYIPHKHTHFQKHSFVLSCHVAEQSKRRGEKRRKDVEGLPQTKPKGSFQKSIQSHVTQQQLRDEKRGRVYL